MYPSFYKHPIAPRSVLKVKDRDVPIVGIWDIDVNGSKAPNQWGRDMFMFFVGADGNLYPRGGREEFFTENNTLNNYDKTSKCSPTAQYALIDADLGCSARIMEEGWRMNY